MMMAPATRAFSTTPTWTLYSARGQVTSTGGATAPVRNRAFQAAVSRASRFSSRRIKLQLQYLLAAAVLADGKGVDGGGAERVEGCTDFCFRWGYGDAEEKANSDVMNQRGA